ncbi:MAG: hypothetical protein ACKV2V_17660 [Blastocatellia bacterium]
MTPLERGSSAGKGNPLPDFVSLQPWKINPHAWKINPGRLENKSHTPGKATHTPGKSIPHTWKGNPRPWKINPTRLERQSTPLENQSHTPGKSSPHPGKGPPRIRKSSPLLIWYFAFCVKSSTCANDPGQSKALRRILRRMAAKNPDHPVFCLAVSSFPSAQVENFSESIDKFIDTPRYTSVVCFRIR